MCHPLWGAAKSFLMFSQLWSSPSLPCGQSSSHSHIPTSSYLLQLLPVHHVAEPTPPITITIYRLNCEILFSTYIGFSSITTSIPREIVPSLVFMGLHIMRTLHSDGVQSLSRGYLCRATCFIKRVPLFQFAAISSAENKPAMKSMNKWHLYDKNKTAVSSVRPFKYLRVTWADNNLRTRSRWTDSR